VYDPRSVRIVEGRGDFACDPQRLGPVKSVVAAQAFAQALTFDERHRVIGNAVRITGIEDRDNVRMLKTRGEQDP
jgi:hypothetical protein